VLWTVLVIIILVLWAWGFITGVVGAMIHLLLVLAAVTALMGVLLSGQPGPDR
jgi:hypothetical protein